MINFWGQNEDDPLSFQIPEKPLVTKDFDKYSRGIAGSLDATKFNTAFNPNAPDLNLSKGLAEQLIEQQNQSTGGGTQKWLGKEVSKGQKVAGGLSKAFGMLAEREKKPAKPGASFHEGADDQDFSYYIPQWYV
tara:strand:+ start:57 stop:458 length:402 start_codon:yes stop_codon:yes gene_type:complete